MSHNDPIGLRLVDSHTHLYSEQFAEDRDVVVQRAIDAGVHWMLLPNVDRDSYDDMIDLCHIFPSHCVPMLGLHPTSVGEDYRDQLDWLWSRRGDEAFCAIGEIGLDFYWDTTYAAQQTEAFEEQLRWSLDLDLPVSIHARAAHDAVVESMKRVGADKVRGAFHSFSGTTLAELEEVLAMPKMLLGINGTITYKNSKLPAVIAEAPLERLMIETDAPYLPPVPYRGKRNESSYLTLTAQKIADVKGCTLEEVIRTTTINAQKLFALCD